MAITLISPTSIDPDDADDLASINSSLLALSLKRKTTIAILDDPLKKSKIAWKIAYLTNALLYRFVALADGTAGAWNSGNMLSAILNARAMIETVAIFYDFAERLATFASKSDFSGMDALSMNRLFGTRDEDLLKDDPDLKAFQVLNAIDDVDKNLVPHFRSHYDRLSERCHPNSLGHRAMFSKLDQGTGVALFSDKFGHEYFAPIKCALGASDIFHYVLHKVELLIPTVAKAHDEISPSPLK
jgi:hypothetical protein